MHTKLLAAVVLMFGCTGLMGQDTAFVQYTWGTLGQVRSDSALAVFVVGMPPAGVSFTDSARVSYTFPPILFEKDSSTVATQHLAPLDGISAFPNPVGSDLFTLTRQKVSQEYEVEMFEASGQLLSQRSWLVGEARMAVETSSLLPGTYFVRIVNGQGTEASTFKLIKTR